MNTPSIYHADEIKNWSHQREISPGNWVPARPLGLQGWFPTIRLRAAWKVLIGEYDALKWNGQ